MTARTLDFPERINIEPTNFCNMHCRLCPHPLMQRPKGHMDLGLFRGIVRDCAAQGAAVWLQYMGEPLLHPGIIEMISMAKDAGLEKVGLSTNAYYLDERLGQRILESGLDRLECSVDALNEREFQQCRGSPDYHKVIGNIRSFLVRKKEMGNTKTVTSIQYMAFSVSRRDRVSQAINQWKDWLDENDFIMSIQDYSFAGSVRPSIQKDRRTPCHWIFTDSVILWDGTMVMCGSDFDGRAAMGNLNHQSIAEVWHGPNFEAVRKLHRSRSWDNHPLCRDCDDWRLSDGSGYVNLIDNGSS